MEDGEKAEKTEDDESGKDQQDVVFIQDVGFTVKVVAPNVESFDIQVINKTKQNESVMITNVL